MMFRRIGPSAWAAVALSLLGAVGHTTFGMSALATDPRAVIGEQLQLSQTELTALAQGQPVAKTLSASAPREMTTGGAVRIRGSAMARFVDQFKTLEGFRTSQFVLQIQKFGEKPVLADLDALTLDAEDIASLKTCRLDACGVQLGAEDILRIRHVNWNAATAAQDVTTLYRTLLFEQLVRYRASGTKGLPHYRDHERGVRLARETQSLLDARPSLLDQVPELQDHMRRYPAGPHPHIEDFFYWSKEAFGFKPVIGLNHVYVHTDATSGRVTIVTTQIYASHYIEGSLGVNALMPDRASDETAFYWAHVNRARVGRLGGLLGAIARPLVQRRARAGLMKSLQQTKQRFEAASRAPLSR